MTTPRLRSAQAVVLLLTAAACAAFAATAPKPANRPAATVASKPAAPDAIGQVEKSDAAWRAQLAPESYRVLRHAGTEIAFTGKLWSEHRAGTYACAGCGLELFTSKTKYESGTGWPSFWAPVAKNHVREVPDTSYGSVETEIRCARCDGHLGHVFEDGPRPTGLRYCMNSAALAFTPAAKPR